MTNEIQKQKRHSRATFRCSKWRGATKTKLMYKAYLSFNQLREYLTLLVENGLIEYEGGQKYRTTEKGMRLLQLQNEIDEVAPVSFIKE